MHHEESYRRVRCFVMGGSSDGYNGVESSVGGEGKRRQTARQTEIRQPLPFDYEELDVAFSLWVRRGAEF